MSFYVICSNAQVYSAAWWMQLYGSLTPKRHIAWSNSATVRKLDLGVLAREVREKLSSKRKSSKTYKNKRGRKAFCGTRHLRGTQKLEFNQVKRWYETVWICFGFHLFACLGCQRWFRIVASIKKTSPLSKDVSSKICTSGCKILRSFLW